MASLTTHLTAGDRHGSLAFRGDCPTCRDERLAGTLADGPIVARRAQASLAAAVLALSAASPAATAIAATPPPGDEEGTNQPQTPPQPSEEPPSFDPGGEDPLQTEGPPPTPTPDAGPDDDTEGAPVETEPDEDLADQEPTPAPPVAVTPPPAPPAAQPAPAPEPPVAPPPAPATPLAEGDTTPGAIVDPDPLTASVPGPPRSDQTEPPRAQPRELAPGISTPPIDAPSPDLLPLVDDAAPAVGTSTAPARASDPASAADGRMRVVQPGESLWAIATDLAGPAASDAEVARLVNRLWQLNDDRIATGSPDLLPVGTTLELP